MAEYAAYYGGPPAPDLPWPLFLALTRRTAMFEARLRLTLLGAVERAIGTALGGSDDPHERDAMVRHAYPLKDRRAVAGFVRNMLAENGDSDGG